MSHRLMMVNERVKRLAWSFVSPTAFLSLLSLLAYFSFRLRCLIKVQQIAGGNLSGSWFYLALEALTLIPKGLPYVLRILAVRPPVRFKKRLISGEAPTVDVLITCCNEDIEVIINTVRAACVLDYPQDRYRVFVCDDGSSNEVKTAVENLPYSHVFYTARVKGPIKDYKAGNLNASLAYSRMKPMSSRCCMDKELPSPPQLVSTASSVLEFPFESSRESLMFDSKVIPLEILSISSDHSEYVAGLDADMIPEPHWLKAMLPHFIDDRNLGLACPPQTFYDVPTNDPLNQTMQHFAGIIEVINDALGHADCLGSGYVVRRSAIEQIGGFPTESLSEDVCCSATLLGAGWKTLFVHETLQYGSVPDSFFAHVKQRTRWFIGHAQTAVLFRLRFFGHRGRYLTFIQRLVGLSFDLTHLVQIPIILAYFSIPFALLSGYPLVTYSGIEDLRNLIRFASVWMICHWIHQGTIGIVAGLGNGFYDMRLPSTLNELDRWLAPYIAITFFRSFILPKRLGGRKAGFTATGSLRNDLRERDQHHRAPLHRRLWAIFIQQHLIIQLIFLLATVSGVALCFTRAFTGLARVSHANPLQSLPTTSTDRLIYLIVRVGWPPLIWLQYVNSILSPVLYVFFPSTNHGWDHNLIRDEKTGVMYPTQEARKPRRNKWILWRYIRPTVSMTWTVALLVISTRI
ncbi:nucleotide-diphospho-sugar transferase [Pseudovirgaria hyperparasitica]|uniref:Nucleotide-diphospho-sugar transferase n=1 Tax=Pseudovirgaria hyperparasitica TaxID=470096 RepID=A0A6A6WBB3_9PEZI|nr:nucleotide-diphospho-sugar transferase [Pseudovirgaria hyperparasitica]KAF2759334.1 nucleotide-diphospho-sugar transferase [Pseudovirgaria hyperparasitica]